MRTGVKEDKEREREEWRGGQRMLGVVGLRESLVCGLEV